MARRIHRKGDFRHEEANAGADGLYPGMLVQLASDGDVEAHSTEGGYAERCILLEDALQGKTVSDAYTSGAKASYGIFAPGSEFNGLIAAGENVTKGTKMVSNGKGKFIAQASATSGSVYQIVAVMMEAVDASAADTLGAMRML